MEQIKALNALEPFLALSKSATSARAAADLIVRATSAPNTFLFAELLQTPQIQALASAPDQDLARHLDLLRTFSYGTYADALRAGPGLPALNDAQRLKLRQLSLLSLARDSNRTASTDNAAGPVLGYASLLAHLDLAAPRELEELVISTVYAGLIDAQLDPKNALVRINSVAPLRDVALGDPGSSGSAVDSGAIGGLLSSLRAWAGRCDATLLMLESQMSDLRESAGRRAAQSAAWSDRMESLVVESEQTGGKASGDHGAKTSMLTTVGAGSNSFASAAGVGRGRVIGANAGGYASPAPAANAAATPPTTTAAATAAATAVAGSASAAAAGIMKALRHGSKRGSGHMDASGSSDLDDEAMDLDEEDVDSGEGKKRSSRRKLQG